jgi:hypothetical protein
MISMSMITEMFRLTCRILCVNPRDSTANKFEDEDLADKKLREIILEDLTDINWKLDCLSREDLYSSYSFLKEGIIFLNLALDESNEDQKASEGPEDKAIRVVNDTTSSIFEALSLPQEIQRLKSSPDKRFVSAQDCFKASREQATFAFINHSLHIKDRILACKLRVTSSILESGLRDPKMAICSCLMSLKELHGLPEIQEMFAVFLKGGLKSKWKKAERLENIMSVLLMNRVLFDFALKYSKTHADLSNWPAINLADRTFHPIQHAHEILPQANDEHHENSLLLGPCRSE